MILFSLENQWMFSAYSTLFIPHRHKPGPLLPQRHRLNLLIKNNRQHPAGLILVLHKVFERLVA